MPSYYTYLISSLPAILFGMKPPFSFEKFLKMCEGLISEGDIEILKTSSVMGEYTPNAIQPTLRRWRAFDTALRNELVRIRASRKRLDPQKYVRRDGYIGSYTAHIAMNAYRDPSILEAEKMLDQERWRALDELAIGHYFDIDCLIAYAHKLLILERWERIRTADRARLLEEAMAFRK